MKYTFLGLILFCNYLNAQVSIPNFFTNNMVLQRNIKIPIWGWASINEKITVTFNNQTTQTIANKNGEWVIYLKKQIAGGPYTLLIEGKNKVKIENILIGDVWLCTGQSNMEWTVAQSNNAIQEIANANYPFIRHIKIAHNINSLPQKNITDQPIWNVCNSATVGNFSGVAYFFAKHIYDSTKVPIGLINTCWGGTNIETWISREGFESNHTFKTMIQKMPNINLQELEKQNITSLKNRLEQLQHQTIDNRNSNNWKEENIDDANWPAITAPGLWEEQSIGNMDGIVWLRKKFYLAKEDIQADAQLYLAKIDDNDTTYINSNYIGTTNQWDANRKYNVPKELLHIGENIISIKIVDNGGGGGIYGDSTKLKLVTQANQISLVGSWKFNIETLKQNINENAMPSLCYNAMIAPLTQYAVNGTLWYQGESNANRAYAYRTAFPLLINNWRSKFGNKKMPFYFAQLASFETAGNSNQGCAWAELREAQTLTLALPNTGMVVTTDLVTNPKDIHPINKQDVGKRLASIALNNLYNKKMTCSGPTYDAMKINGNQIWLTFKNIGTGLAILNKNDSLKGFEIAGSDSVFYEANAFLKNNTIIVWSNKVPNPTVVNFGWLGNATQCNLYNKEGFPAVPFRTKAIKNITIHNKFSF